MEDPPCVHASSYWEANIHGPALTMPPSDKIKQEDKYEIEHIVTHKKFTPPQASQFMPRTAMYILPSPAILLMSYPLKAL